MAYYQKESSGNKYKCSKKFNKTRKREYTLIATYNKSLILWCACKE